MTVRAKRKQAYHHGNLRVELIDAALKLAKENGVRAVSLTDAAKALGVSAAAPYRHFADKEALLAAAAERCFIEFTEALQAGRRSTENALEGVLRQGEAYVRFGQKSPERLDLMFSMHFTKPCDGLDQASSAAYEELLEGVRGLVREGRLSESSLQSTAHQLWFLAHGAATIGSASPSGLDAMALLRESATVLIKGRSG